MKQTALADMIASELLGSPTAGQSAQDNMKVQIAEALSQKPAVADMKNDDDLMNGPARREDIAVDSKLTLDGLESEIADKSAVQVPSGFSFASPKYRAIMRRKLHSSVGE